MENANYILYSDGGGEQNGLCAGACICHDLGQGRQQRLICFLGTATNNEAEITAGLIGFSLLNLWKEEQKLSSAIVQWVCDSEYVLKSATDYIVNWRRNGWRTAAKKPVKNQGLWRAYLMLSENFQIFPKHVYGHAGHPENEACDRAVSYGRQNGEVVLAEQGEGSIVSIGSGNLDCDWILLNGRTFLETLRVEHPQHEQGFSFVEKLRNSSRPGN